VRSDAEFSAVDEAADVCVVLDDDEQGNERARDKEKWRARAGDEKPGEDGKAERGDDGGDRDDLSGVLA